MTLIRLTRQFNFEMAHALQGYDGPCRQIHGHSYKLFVTVAGTPSADGSDPKVGMVMDFGLLKDIVTRLIVDRYDHAFVMRADDSSPLAGTMRREWENVVTTPFQPTCENMIIEFVRVLKEALPPQVRLVEVALYETERSHASWRAEDNQ